jgi:hypothetical protein
VCVCACACARAGSEVCKGDGGWLRREVRVGGCVASCDELHRIDSIWRVELNSANSGLSPSLSAAPLKLIRRPLMML